MLVVFLPVLVGDANIIFGYNFGASLKICLNLIKSKKKTMMKKVTKDIIFKACVCSFSFFSPNNSP